MADKAYITSNVLKWARESARMTLETAAAKLPVTPQKLEDWEEGNDYPTIKQAEKLANAYKRPFALFFLPEVPKDFQPLQDFRRKTAVPLGTASTFIIREVQQKQAWISDVIKDNESEPLSFVGRYSLEDGPKDVAYNILTTLDINPKHYETEPIKEWIDKAETKGIFISRSSFIHTRLKLDSDELQGFAIVDSHAPFVFVNSDDWNAPQLFTLVHELAHVWIGATGISSEIEPEQSHSKSVHPIELFCNEVAAEALMPEVIMRGLGTGIYDDGREVFKAAKKLGVSSFAFLVRALKLQYISLTQYRNLKREADADFRNYLEREQEKALIQKEKKGGPNPYLLRLNRNSRLFTQIVLDAFRGGFVEPTIASRLLNTPVNHFSKLEGFLYK